MSTVRLANRLQTRWVWKQQISNNSVRFSSRCKTIFKLFFVMWTGLKAFFYKENQIQMLFLSSNEWRLFTLSRFLDILKKMQILPAVDLYRITRQRLKEIESDKNALQLSPRATRWVRSEIYTASTDYQNVSKIKWNCAKICCVCTPLVRRPFVRRLAAMRDFNHGH